MEFLEKIRDFSTENKLFDGRDLIVGCSGGADSVALLYVLRAITDSRIHVVHVNHGLRQEAKRDEDFVVDLCKTLDIGCKVYSFDVSSKASEFGRSVEDTGRILRYQAFEDLSYELFGEDKNDRSVICLAHHKDDLAETFLMNIFRGSGLEGLVSPKAKSDRVIRPLLCVTKKEILEYLDEIGQAHCEDATNFENCCTRNIWRNDVLPKISEVSVKKPSSAIFETYELLSDDLDLVTALTDEAYSKYADRKNLTLDTAVFKNCHKAIAQRLVRNLWKDTFGNLTDFEKKHVESVIGLCTDNGATGRTLDLPFSNMAFVAGGRLGFCKSSEKENGLIRAMRSRGLFLYDSKSDPISLADIQKTTKIPNSNIKINLEIVENIEAIRYNTISWFCPFSTGSEIHDLKFGPLDRSLSFKRAGTSHTTVCDKLFGDLKVPSAVRDLVCGVYDGEQVLWIPGVGHAIGFTDDVSMSKFIEGLGNKGLPDIILKVEVLEV